MQSKEFSMKNKKFIGLLSFLTVACLGASLAGCNIDGGKGSGSHHFSTEWSSDAEGHRHLCTDEGCTETSGEAAHKWEVLRVITPASCTDAGEEEVKCEVCGYTTERTVKAYGHNYTSEVTKQPTEDEKGEKTFTCQNCHDVYTEEIPATSASEKGYKITVYGADDKPFAGADVEIDGHSGKTGADGAAEFADIVRGAFDLNVTATGYTDTHPQTTGTAGEYSVYLSKIPDNGTLAASGSGKTRYAIDVDWQPDPEMPSMIAPEEKTYTVKNTGAQAAEFTITLKDNVAYSGHSYAPPHSVGIFNSAGPSDADYKPVSVVLESGESYDFGLTADYTAFDAQDKTLYPIIYDVEITCSKAPDKGGSKKYMYDAAPDGKTEVTAQPDTPVYFKCDTTAAQYAGAEFVFTFDSSDLTIINLGQVPDSVSGPAITSGQPVTLSDYFATVLKVTSKSGNISFSAAKDFAEGLQNNPIAITVGDNITGSVGFSDRDRDKWYSITNDTGENKTYTIVPDGEKGKKMSAYVYAADGSTVTYSVEGKKFWFDIPAGETYKIAVSNSDNAGEFAFGLRYYDPDTDIGGDKYDNPLTYVVKAGEQTCTLSLPAGGDTAKFFTFETATPGYYTVSIECNDASADALIAESFVYPIGDAMSNHPLVLDNTLCLDKITVCIKASRYNTEAETVWSVHINFVPLLEAENTVTVNGDAEIVGGLTVQIVKNGSVIASGVTGSDGVAHISFIPGIYDIKIEGLDGEAYGYLPAKTHFVKEGGAFGIDIGRLGTYTFTVTNPDDSAVGGATVTLKSGDSVVATGQTDGNGAFTTGKIVLGEYDISVAVSGNYYLKPVKTSAAATDVTLKLTAPAEIYHESDTSVPALEEGKTVITNASSRSGRYNYQFTAAEAGTYTITMSNCTVEKYGVYSLYLSVDGTTLGDAVLSSGVVIDELNAGNILTVDESSKNGNYYATVTIKLEAGQTIGMALCIYAMGASATVDIVKN